MNIQMLDKQIEQLAGEFLQLMPLLRKKLLKPIEKTPSDLSPLQMHVLFFLKDKEPLSMSEIAEKMGVLKQQMTYLTNKLEENQLIERIHDKKDRRSVKISITEAGIAALKVHKKLLLDLIINKFNQLSDEDIRELKDVIQSITTLLNKLW